MCERCMCVCVCVNLHRPVYQPNTWYLTNFFSVHVYNLHTNTTFLARNGKFYKIVRNYMQAGEMPPRLRNVNLICTRLQLWWYLLTIVVIWHNTTQHYAVHISARLRDRERARAERERGRVQINLGYRSPLPLPIGLQWPNESTVFVGCMRQRWRGK